jgi:hypothetical protein
MQRRRLPALNSARGDGALMPQDRPLLTTRDYEDAIAEFVRDAVHSVMAASDDVYAGLRRMPMPEGVTTVSVQVDEAVTDSPEVEMRETVEIRRDDVVAGELEMMHDAVAHIAESHLAQFMAPFFEHVGDAASAVGNSVDLSGDAFGWDGLLDAFEQVRWLPDATGRVRAPQMHAGALVQARLRGLPDFTPEQAQRWADMQRRKQEEHVSRRRSRRLR